MDQDGIRDEQGFWLIKDGLGYVVPVKLDFFLEELQDWASNCSEAFDESLVKIGESDEDLDIADSNRRRPLSDHLDLGRVHGDILRRDDKSEEFDLGDVELTFLQIHL